MNRRLHNFSLHAFGLLVMFASAGVVFLFAESLRDLYQVADEYGKGMIGGTFVGVFSCVLLKWIILHWE